MGVEAGIGSNLLEIWGSSFHSDGPECEKDWAYIHAKLDFVNRHQNSDIKEHSKAFCAINK